MELNKVVMVAPWWLRAVGAWQNLGQDIVDASAGFFGCLIYFVVVCRHSLFTPYLSLQMVQNICPQLYAALILGFNSVFGFIPVLVPYFLL